MRYDSHFPDPQAVAPHRHEAAAGRPLENLGITELEERVYRWLLARRGAAAAEVARALDLTSAKAQRLLDALEDKGLATHTPERPRRYIPSSPDVALEALIAQRQKGLQDAKAAVQELQSSAVSAEADAPEHIVELITNRDAERQILDQMEITAEREFLTLMRLPMRITQYDVTEEEFNRTQRSAQSRGIRYRSVIDSELMELPGYAEGIRFDVKAGEEVRMIPGLPLKLALVDRRLALIPLNLLQEDSPSLLVRSSALLDALYELFETLWQRAAPISFARSGEARIDRAESDFSGEVTELVSLLAGGLNDKTIAYDLNISKRTLERRVAKLMATLDARTRFQVGWFAALILPEAGPRATPGIKRGKRERKH